MIELTGLDSDNDNCVDATPIFINGLPIAGDTTSSESETFLDTCGGVASLGSGGLYYTFEGDGGRLVLGVIADFDSQLLLYSGSCFSLDCIDGSDDDFSFTEYQSAVEFDSVNGQTYFALVMGFGTSTGTFELELTQLIPPDDDLTGGSNEDCETATPVDIDGPPIAGDTTGTEMEVGLETCGTNLGAGGLWFSWQGTGGPLLVGVAAQYDSKLSVYSGSCFNLDCVDGNDDNFDYAEYNSAVEIDSVAGVTYYALVHGFLESVGQFEFEVTQLTTPDDDFTAGLNEDCETATPVEIGGAPVAGNTTGTAMEFGLETCGDVSTLGPGGLWYSWSGTGGTLVVGVDAQFDSQLLVYTGSCGALICVDGNDDNFDFSEYQSALELDSVAGVTYYALVHGFAASATGAFEFEVTELSPPLEDDVAAGDAGTEDDTVAGGLNEDCENATLIEIGDSPLAGDTTGTDMVLGLDTCGGVSNLGSGGLWYSLIGTGETLLIGVEDAQFDSQLLVYSGNCSDLVCIDGNDDNFAYSEYQSALELDSVAGETYYALVTGFSNSAGSFEFVVNTLSELESATTRAPSDAACQASVPIIFGESIVGSTLGAPQAELFDCLYGLAYNASSVFYRFTGTGNGITLSFNASFDAQVNIFAGEDCGNLACVSGGSGNGLVFDDIDGSFQSPSGTLRFYSRLGETYFVSFGEAAFSGSNSGGDFELFVKDGFEVPVNSQCSQAIVIESMQTHNGTTDFSLAYSEDPCAM